MKRNRMRREISYLSGSLKQRQSGPRLPARPSVETRPTKQRSEKDKLVGSQPAKHMMKPPLDVTQQTDTTDASTQTTCRPEAVLMTS